MSAVQLRLGALEQKGVRGSRELGEGIAIHIGLNRVDPDSYSGWRGQLSGCENDARAMKAVAESVGYNCTLLLNEQATSATVIAGLGQAALALRPGDILLLTYSGHGGQVPDVNGDEDDGQDETWVLYDRMLIDDELYQLWSQFQAGVRIFMLSDSCHSGSMARALIYSDLATSASMREHYKGLSGNPPAFRLIDTKVQDAIYQRDRQIYNARQWAAARGDATLVTASVILISGCQDNQLSSDGARNGLFTERLLGVWEEGAFEGNYRQFWSAVSKTMPPAQTPNYFKAGCNDVVFEGQKPFTI